MWQAALICTLLALNVSANEAQPAPITIDGDASDWQGHLVYQDEYDVEVGTWYDAKYLYICLKSSNKMTSRMITARGLDVWFDHKGKKKKRFGIGWPLGMRQDDGEPRQRGSQSWEPDAMAKRMDTMLSQLKIHKSKKDHEIVSISDLKGIQVEADFGPEGFVYELRVPFTTDAEHPYAIGGRGDEVGIGFIGPKPERKRGGRGGGMAAGGRGGGRGGFGGGMSGMGGGGRGGMGGGKGFGGGGRGGPGAGAGGQMQRPEPLKLWITAKIQD